MDYCLLALVYCHWCVLLVSRRLCLPSNCLKMENLSPGFEKGGCWLVLCRQNTYRGRHWLHVTWLSLDFAFKQSKQNLEHISAWRSEKCVSCLMISRGHLVLPSISLLPRARDIQVWHVCFGRGREEQRDNRLLLKCSSWSCWFPLFWFVRLWVFVCFLFPFPPNHF